MISLIRVGALFFLSVFLTACAAVSIKSQIAPNISLTKNNALYLNASVNAPIAHQKYIATLRDVLNEQEFNLVQRKSDAQYIMSVHFNDFSASIVQVVPDTQTTIYDGNIGTVPIGGSSVTIGSKQVYREIPTHNSQITITDRVSEQQIWEVSMAKSFDVYNHNHLKGMIEKMISLYGKDGKTTKIVEDQVRW